MCTVCGMWEVCDVYCVERSPQHVPESKAGSNSYTYWPCVSLAEMSIGKVINVQQCY